MTLGNKIKALLAARGWSHYKLAEKTGIPRVTITAIANDKRKPSAEYFLKLARAFDIPVEELYVAAGYEVGEKVERREEPLEEKAARFLLEMPVSIPVYTEFQPSSGGTREEPVKYIYRRRDIAVGRNIEAYLISGQHLKLDISDGDIVLVDRDLHGEAGDVVLCLHEGRMILAQLVLEGAELWLVFNKRKVRFDECEVSAKVIEVRKQLE